MEESRRFRLRLMVGRWMRTMILLAGIFGIVSATGAVAICCWNGISAGDVIWLARLSYAVITSGVTDRSKATEFFGDVIDDPELLEMAENGSSFRQLEDAETLDGVAALSEGVTQDTAPSANQIQIVKLRDGLVEGLSRENLRVDEDYDNFSLDVIGTVLRLSGNVASGVVKGKVLQIARELDGVDTVEDAVVINETLKEDIQKMRRPGLEFLGRFELERRLFKRKFYCKVTRFELSQKVLTLHGFVASAEEKQIVLQVAQELDGVDSVRDEIVIKDPFEDMRSRIRSKLR